MQKVLAGVAVLLGILLLIAGGVYAALPASSLPQFYPGYQAAMTHHHHYTHAAAALGLGLVCFAFAWFTTGKKSSSK